MKQYTFKGILQNEGWLENMAVTIDRDGIIVDIEQVNTNEVDSGYALPGFQNAHSHAFQYAMAGLAEKHDANATNGDFWSWREAMYRLALNISPDQLENIATMLYAEMVRHGYTSVAEFHCVVNGAELPLPASESFSLMPLRYATPSPVIPAST